MFLPFFLRLKAVGVPVTLREFLLLLEAMKTGIADFDVEAFYYLARTALVVIARGLAPAAIEDSFRRHVTGEVGVDQQERVAV